MYSAVEVLFLLLKFATSIQHVHATTVRLENARNLTGNATFLLLFKLSYLPSSFLGGVLRIYHLVPLPVNRELLHILTAES